jgi:hypothetical protein
MKTMPTDDFKGASEKLHFLALDYRTARTYEETDAAFRALDKFVRSLLAELDRVRGERDHYVTLFKATKLGHEQAFATCQARAELLRRADRQLMEWARKYGEHDPQWLPPDGDVRLSEDINESLAIDAARGHLVDRSENLQGSAVDKTPEMQGSARGKGKEGENG